MTAQFRTMSNEEILSLIREAGNISIREWEHRENTPSLHEIKARFGSWSTAKRLAGIPGHATSRTITWTSESAIAAIREAGESMTAQRWMAEHRQPAIMTIRTIFGSWNEARAAAGFAPRVQGSSKRRDVFFTRSECIAALQKFSHAVSPQEWQAKKMVPSISVLRENFGSFRAAWKAAHVIVTQNAKLLALVNDAAALSALGTIAKRILLLRAQGYTLKEIGKIVDMPPYSVGFRIRQSLAHYEAGVTQHEKSLENGGQPSH